jgi:hypothetical protein
MLESSPTVRNLPDPAQRLQSGQRLLQQFKGWSRLVGSPTSCANSMLMRHFEGWAMGLLFHWHSP